MYITPPSINKTDFPEAYDGCRGGQGRDSEEVASMGWTELGHLVLLVTIVVLLLAGALDLLIS